MKIIRVQDRNGRGPYRPGFSHVWSDPDGPVVLPWWTELGLDFEAAHAAMTTEFHNGCGFRTRGQLHAWFSDKELRALDRHGFCLAAVNADKVYAETPTQIVFGSVQPLSRPLGWCKLMSRAAEAMVA